MKVSRQVLKEIVKECLIELLAEGIGSIGTVTEAKKPIQRRLEPKISAKRDPAAYNGDLRAKILQEAGGDPVMQQIFEDTARTSMQTMSLNDQKSPVFTEKVSHSPEEIFGEEVSARWADLAFAQPNK